MLKNFSSNFQCILGSQEASVPGMADGFAQISSNPHLPSAYGGVHHQRHEQHDNRISQQCSRNIYVVGTTDHNPQSWRWCRSGDTHTSESSFIFPIVDTFRWGLETQGIDRSGVQMARLRSTLLPKDIFGCGESTMANMCFLIY